MATVAGPELTAALARFDRMRTILLNVPSNTSAQKAEIIAIAWSLRMALLNTPTSLEAEDLSQ